MVQQKYTPSRYVYCDSVMSHRLNGSALTSSPVKNLFILLGNFSVKCVLSLLYPYQYGPSEVYTLNKRINAETSKITYF